MKSNVDPRRSVDPRLSAPVWRHDGYTLRRLKWAIVAELEAAAAAGVLGPRATVVDLGAGTAPYRPLFEGLAERYLACDIEPSDGIDLLLQSGQPLPREAASADMVASFQVLEHVWDLDWYLGECRRLLRPSGRLLLSTHGTWLYHPHPTDFRRWTRDGLLRDIERHGFEIINVRALVGPLAWTTQFRVFGYRAVLQKLGLPGELAGALLNTAMYGRMVVEDAVTPKGLRETNAAIYLVTARPKR